MTTMQIEHKISSAFQSGDTEAITATKEELLAQKQKLDRWFDRYLDLFSDRMETLEKNDPVWKLYDKKYASYQEVSHAIITADYFLRKSNV